MITRATITVSLQVCLIAITVVIASCYVALAPSHPACCTSRGAIVNIDAGFQCAVGSWDSERWDPCDSWSIPNYVISYSDRGTVNSTGSARISLFTVHCWSGSSSLRLLLKLGVQYCARVDSRYVCDGLSIRVCHVLNLVVVVLEMELCDGGKVDKVPLSYAIGQPSCKVTAKPILALLWFHPVRPLF